MDESKQKIMRRQSQHEFRIIRAADVSPVEIKKTMS